VATIELVLLDNTIGFYCNSRIAQELGLEKAALMTTVALAASSLVFA